MRSRQCGSSLIEVLVAALVLSVGVAGLLPMVFGAVRATRAARDTSQAAWLAWQKLEQLRAPADPMASPADALVADTPGFVEHLDEWGRPGAPPGPYTRRWLIEPAGDPGGGALRIAVAVFHAAARGSPVTIATVRRRRQP